MPYPARIRLAAAASILLHLAALGAWALQRPPRGVGPTPAENLVVRLLPDPEPAQPRRLVDPAAPTEETPQTPDQIAEHNAVATDTEIRAGTAPGPQVEEIAEADMLAAPPETAAPPTPPPTPPAPQPAPPAPEIAPMTPVEPPVERMARATPTPRPGPRPAAPEPAPATAPPPAPQTPPTPEREQVAQAPPAPERPAQRSRGRLRDEVKQQGIAGYEAIQSDLAPYLREVRGRVERHWNQALLTRYRGTNPTRAVVDCVIAPDGTLVSATVVDPGPDRLFAGLCKEAIERAAPFGPFPFQVPDIYRSGNLEIRWTFSFL